MTINNDTTSNKRFIIKTFTIVSSIVISITAIISFFIMFNDFIDNKIKSKITDKNYIYNLSKELRPFGIYNKKGVLIYDHGVDKIYIDSLNVNVKDSNFVYFNLYCTKHLELAPIIENISPEIIVVYEPKQNKHNIWKYDVEFQSDFSSDSLKYPILFRIEILK